MTYIPANVERGAQWLDIVEPGWAEKIDPDVLDMTSTCRCVLGQLKGDYYHAVLEFNLTGGEQSRLGFYRWGRQRWGALTEAWRRMIAARQS